MLHPSPPHAHWVTDAPWALRDPERLEVRWPLVYTRAQLQWAPDRLARPPGNSHSQGHLTCPGPSLAAPAGGNKCKPLRATPPTSPVLIFLPPQPLQTSLSPWVLWEALPQPLRPSQPEPGLPLSSPSRYQHQCLLCAPRPGEHGKAAETENGGDARDAEGRLSPCFLPC